MKRNIIFAAFGTALLLAAASCTSDDLMEKGGNFISLELSSKSLDKSLETKATKDGEDPFNENIINSVYYFFYKDGEESAAPVVKGRLIGLGHKSGVRTEEVPVESGTATSLFGSSEECQAFIVANPPKGLEEFLGGSPTLSQLRSKLFLTDLDGIQESFTMIFDDKVAKAAATGNIMTVEAKLKRLANKFTVSLNISDKATGETEWTSVPADAKVEFHNVFSETALGGDFATVKAGDNDYKTHYFNTGLIDFGNPVEDGDVWKCTTERPAYTYSMSWEFPGSPEPYLIIELPWQKATSGETQRTFYKVFFSTKSLSINNWCHLTIELNRLGGYQKDDPVQIFEGMKYLVLDWNKAFEEDYGILTEIDDARYLMMDQTEYWIYGQDSWNFPYTSSYDCEIVDETYETFNYRHRNAEIVSGGSHTLGGEEIYNCTLDGSLITFYHPLNKDFSSTVEEDGIHYGAYDVAPYTFKFRIKHKDNPSYFQDVTVHQYPSIYIEAQPNSAGVYLDPEAYPEPESTTFLNIHEAIRRNVTINIMKEGSTYEVKERYKYFGYGGDPQELLSAAGFGNANGNMYVITTTITPVIGGESYLLADPRQHTNNVADLKKDYECNWEMYKDGVVPNYPCNFGNHYYPVSEEESNNIFITAKALDGTSPRTLQYYYPTKKSADVENVIAPKLRVASSWGQSDALCYEKAVRRCAAYQEDGYPAGRWRLPTKAEVMYICKLSADHMIPMLFGSSNDDFDESFSYWCSTGKVAVYPVETKIGNRIIPIDNERSPEFTGDISFERKQFENGDSAAVHVRCVYDEWYWENRDYNNGTVATEKGRLPEGHWGERYWGDMPR